MKKEKICRFILAVIGIFLVGTGVAFNAAAALGNDPVGIMYDGIRNALGLTGEQLGNSIKYSKYYTVRGCFFYRKALC